MRLLLHVGPHKTATTTIQAMLAQHRTALIANGVFYPEGRPLAHEQGTFPSHSHLPYFLRNFSWAYLGIEESDYQIDNELMAWIIQAQAEACDVLLLSSEEFSRSPLEEWRRFHQALLVAEERSGLRFEGIELFYTCRDSEARLQSIYVEMINHGLASSAEGVVPLIEREATTSLDVMQSLSTQLDERFSVHFVEGVFGMVDGKEVRGGVSHWFDLVLGPELATEIGDDHLELNGRVSELLTEEMLAFNRLNSPPSLRFPEYFATNDLDDEGRDALARFQMFRKQALLRSSLEERVQFLELEVHNLEKVARAYEQALGDLKIQTEALDATRQRISELEQSRSWRWTRWLRRLGGTVNKPT